MQAHTNSAEYNSSADKSTWGNHCTEVRNDMSKIILYKSDERFVDLGTIQNKHSEGLTATSRTELFRDIDRVRHIEFRQCAVPGDICVIKWQLFNSLKNKSANLMRLLHVPKCHQNQSGHKLVKVEMHLTNRHLQPVQCSKCQKCHGISVCSVGEKLARLIWTTIPNDRGRSHYLRQDLHSTFALTLTAICDGPSVGTLLYFVISSKSSQ